MPEKVLIYRSELLPISETFIAAQAAALRTFVPVFAGMRRVPHGLALLAPCCIVAEGDGLAERLRRYAFLRTGYAPPLRRALRKQNPVLLHAHFAVDAAQALPLARALEIPLIVTLHGYDIMASDESHRDSRNGRVYLARRERLWDEASLFLCVSEAIRRKAIERGFPAHKLRVHAIGIDLAQYRPPVHTERDPIVLFVGRLVEKKGCLHLIRAMGEVRRVLPQARLIVLGDGPERAHLEAEANRWGSQAIFLGVQTGEQVRHWMASSRVLAVPSITARNGDAEGLPTVLCEALAMGLPVACFRSSGIPELVRDQVEGLLAEEGDEAGLAENLLRLCQDDALAGRMGAAGRRRVESSFALDAQTEELEGIYSSVLQPGTGLGPEPAALAGWLYDSQLRASSRLTVAPDAAAANNLDGAIEDLARTRAPVQPAAHQQRPG
jgi:glycosyltransferase involved in cell wall biosynthesis